MDYKEIEEYYDNFFESDRTPYEKYRSTDANNRILEAIKGKGGKLLDLGCGNGELIDYLMQGLGKGQFHFYGVDLSKVNIKRSKLGEAAQVNLEKRLPFKSESFEVVVLQEIIEHLRNREQVMDEVHRILKKDGVVVVTCPHKYNLIYPLYFVKNVLLHRMQPVEDWLSKRQLHRLMKPRFRSYRLKSHNFFPYHSIMPKALIPLAIKIDKWLQNTPVDRKLIAVGEK